MNKFTILLGFLIIGLFLFGCTAPVEKTGLIGFTALDDSKATNEGVKELVLANNKFAIDYYNQIENGENLFFSPFSISSALAMTYEGAYGKTREEMGDVFYFPEDNSLRRSSYARIYNKLNENASKGNYSFNIANSLWLEQSQVFKEGYLETIKNYYYGTIEIVDFKNNFLEMISVINNWIENQTSGKITNILKDNPPDLTKDTAFVLVNAIYFKGDWLEQFKESNTKEKDFYVNKETIVKAQMMNQKNGFRYYMDENFQYLELPYKGEDISMIVALPIKPGTISTDAFSYEKLVEFSQENIVYDFDLPSAETLMDLNNKMRTREVDVYLPKFKLETEYQMNEDLIEMGMIEAFDEWTAQFDNMWIRNPSENLYISKVIHKAFVEVNEEGTEAAAATVAIGAVATSAPARPIEFNANHPFAFYLQENSTGEILFLGKVVKPN